MKRLQAYKFELIPDGEQQRNLGRFAGDCRFVFNKALALQKANYEAGGKFIVYEVMAKQLTDWRSGSETPWLKNAPVHPLQHALKDLERAYKNFFAKRADFPRFKRKGQKDSFRYPDAKQFKLDAGNARIFLPKLGWMRLRLSRKVLGTLKNATVSMNGGKWFVSLQTEREVDTPVHHALEASIGIDLGARKDAACASFSDGNQVRTLNAHRCAEHRLKHYQRVLARKVKGSKNRKKAHGRLQMLHTRVANLRRDFLHKLSSDLTDRYSVIAIEDLVVKKMSSTKTSPKRKNKAILDQGWFEFRRQLEYKAEWKGGEVIAIDPAYTSSSCRMCGFTHEENRTTPDDFTCLRCGHHEQADIHAAKNILSRGLNTRRAGYARIACGENASPEQSGSLREAGTHRSDREAGIASAPGAVGIPFL